MPVTVLLADDATVVRNAIRTLLAIWPEIDLVGEAADFPQAIEMMNDLKPQVIVMELQIARRADPSEVRDRLSKAKVLAISLSNDVESKELADSYGAVVLLDKMNLYEELVPTIVKVAFPTDLASTV